SQIVLFSIVPGLICLLAIALFIQEVPGRKVLPAATRRPIWPARGELSPAYYRFLAAAGLFALANSSDAFLLLRSHQMGVPAAGIPLLWALLHLVKTSTSVLGGRLSDRIGRRPVLIAGWLWYGFVYAGFGLAPASAWAWILFALYGLFFGLTEGAARAYVADLVPKSTRGKAYGLLSMTEGLLALPASLLFGLLWEWQDSHAPPFVLSGILAALAALILVQRNDKSGPPSVAGGHPRDPRDRFEATGG
ncbi:MAG: MFS transporter, partial [Pedosphaera parvula]|nr:MFS transporter [Pedosphaera parvula]